MGESIGTRITMTLPAKWKGEDGKWPYAVQLRIPWEGQGDGGALMWHLLKPGDDPFVDWHRRYGDRADDQGWSLFECVGDGHPPIELQRSDDMAIFDDDPQAWRFVVRNAQAGDLACATALHVLAACSPPEHALIIAHVTDRPGALA